MNNWTYCSELCSAQCCTGVKQPLNGKSNYWSKPGCFPPIPMWPPLLNVAPLVLASPLNPSRIGSKRSLIAIKPSATPPTSNQSSFSQSIIFDTRPLSLQLWIWSFLLAEHWLNKEQNDHRRHLILQNIVITSKQNKMYILNIFLVLVSSMHW